MVRNIILAFFLMLIAAVTFLLTQYTVPPGSVAVVLRNDKIVRLSGAGMHFRVPFLDMVHMISIYRHHRSVMDSSVRLADGTDCRIRTALIMRVENAVRAFEWRRDLEPGFGSSDSTDDGFIYAHAAEVFRPALLELARQTTPDAAANGAIEKWLKAYRRDKHDDGTMILEVVAESVSCSMQDPDNPRSTQTRPVVAFGPLQPFRGLEPLPVAPGNAKVRQFELGQEELITRDLKRVRFERLVIRYVIADAERFRNNFGDGARARQIAESRLGHFVGSALRRVIGQRDATTLSSFHPPEIATFHSGNFAHTLTTVGVRLLDIGGEQAGYRVALTTP